MKKKLMYAPWRHNYVNKTNTVDKTTLKNECVFCHELESATSEESLILKRFKYCSVMMNKYPYNVGHLLILPNEHIADLRDMSSEIRTELFNAVAECLTVVEKTLNSMGFNIGINMGVAGGGGIPKHLHVHVLPRWVGDTNFLETIGETKVLSSDVQTIYKKLKDEFKKLTK